MESKELRLGNIIKSDTSKLLYWEVTIDDMAYIFNKPENYSGVELTEDWLLRFGFEDKVLKYNIENDCYNFKTIELSDAYGGVENPNPSQWDVFLKDYWEDGNEKMSSIVMLLSEIHYVHQLQNLYFALTNQELILLDTQ